MSQVRPINGDCIRAMRLMVALGVRVDSVVCDPPYHLQSIVKRFAKTGRTESTTSRSGPHQRTARGFMGKQWDGGDIAFRPETWRLCFDLLKPGGYIFAFSGSRTYHRMACAIEDAGFIVHPMKGWIFGQGFPKAHNPKIEGMEGWRYGGQTFKPALEPIFFGQKPPDRKMRDNIRTHGTGAINVDACRVFGPEDAVERDGEPSQLRRYTERGGTDFAAHSGRRYKVKRLEPGATLEKTGGNWRPDDGPVYEGELKPGRWPANVVHDGSDEVLAAFPDTGAGQIGGNNDPNGSLGYHGGASGRSVPGIADAGTTARFFYAAKAGSDDRHGSLHPTVKPVALIRWLIRAVTPPGGLTLDPFAGSGTTGIAAIREGMDAILIEREAEYFADIKRRIAALDGSDTPLFGGTEAPPRSRDGESTASSRTKNRPGRIEEVAAE